MTSFDFQWRRPPMRDDIQIFDLEYLSNYFLDYTKILNLSLDDQTVFCKSLKWRWPPMEDDLKIFKEEYLSLVDQSIFYKCVKFRGPLMEDDLRHKDNLKPCRIWMSS